MEKNNNKMNSFFLKYSKLSIILVYNFGTILGLAIFYPLIPILMGYPEGMLEIGARIAVSYDLQYIVVAIVSVIVGTTFLLFLLKGIGRWQEVINEENTEQIEKIRNKCINLPYTIFMTQVGIIGILIPVFIGIVCIVNRTPISQFLKISTVVFSLFSLIAVFSHIFSKRLFTMILIKTYRGEELQGRRLGIRSKIFLQILPMFMVAILFTSVIGYARLMEEKGNMVYNLCKFQLNQIIENKSEFDSTNELFEALNEIRVEDAKVSYFALDKSNVEFFSSDSHIPGTYFKYYVQNPEHGDRVYGDSYDVQGVVANITVDGKDYIAGVRFENASDKTITFFIFALFGLMAINIFVLNYFSKSIKDEISLVADGLRDIAEDEQVDLDRKLAVVSNDELGDLVIAFNKLQEKEKEYVREREEQQVVLMEQERLASLGQLIGGISHNLWTPIMSLSGAIEGLKDLVDEYDKSIGDNNVTEEDHHQIAQEMNEWLEKMKPHCAYMSDIITAVKDQTVQPTTEQHVSFTLDEIAKRVDLLMNHELRRYRCKLKSDFNADMQTEILGDVSLLVQVLNNLIINSIESYEGKGGEIEFKVFKRKKIVEFVVQDSGKGIPEEVKDKLFREMITTKGKNGTGLGLFMSYSNIKARFKGKMWFESEEGKGTTFHIEIPVA